MHLKTSSAKSNEPSVSLFLCDPVDWQRVLIAEYAISSLERGVKVVVYDCESLGEPMVKNILRKFGVVHGFKKKIVREFNSRQIPFFPVESIRYNLLSFIAALTIRVPKILESNHLEFRAIYPSLVNQTGRLEIPMSKFGSLFRLEFKKAHAMKLAISNLEPSSIDSAIIVNGRFSKSLVLREWLRARGINTQILEFASNRNKYELFDISPHSNSDLSSKIGHYWETANPANREMIAQQFFQTLRDTDPSAGISWSQSMKLGNTPSFPPGKKVLTFFSSSESEFVGVRDVIPEGCFQNQASALEEILRLTDPSEWVIYLRRHPKRPGSSAQDIENCVWSNAREYPHLVEIEPTSDIDSFALGMNSLVVAHFDSSIGPQLINMGHPRVVTLGKSCWEFLDFKHHLTTPSMLEEFFKNPSDYKPNVFPWAYFRAVYGISFSKFTLNHQNMSWDLSVEKLNPNFLE